MNDFYEAHRGAVYQLQFLDRISGVLSPSQLRVNP